VDILPEVDETN